MKRHPAILTGTALGLLMASSPLFASPLQVRDGLIPPSGVISGSVTFVQAPCEEGEAPESCAQKQAAPAEPEQAQQPAPEAQPVPEAAPAPVEPAPAVEAPVVETPAVEAPAAAEPQANPQVNQPAADHQKREKRQPKKQAEPEQPELSPPAEAEKVQEAAPENAAPAPEQAPAPIEPQAEPKPKSKSDKAEKSRKRQQPTDAIEQPIQNETTPELPAADKAPVPELKTPPATEQLPTEAVPTPAPVPAREKPAVVVEPTAAEQAAPVEAAPNDGKQAPLFDSQKDVKRPARDGGAGRPRKQQPAQLDPAQLDQRPPPANDKAAQEAISPEKLVPVTQEKGKRVDKAPEMLGRERPKGADVLKEIGDRVIIQFNNQTMVESDERARMRTGARDVYYEDLPRGRTREIIVRQNGSQVVTIRNRNGDVIQRSRITPDGREHVLSYVDENHYQDMRDWRDPGDDLPPMQLDISRDDYILDSMSVKNPERYYDFLEQPPVERVQRLYSVDEVKRSSRVRDIARRIDLDTLNFEFGSAAVPQSEVTKLQGVADAMEKLLTRNPAETFLIEGHTDAVGTDVANLALSDRRAEAVAEALSNVFGIPPENLATQGYGEQYLKVRTQAPERENRRVAIRRITPLVAPMARSN